MQNDNENYVLNLLRKLKYKSSNITKLVGTISAPDGNGGTKDVLMEFRQTIRNFEVYIDVFVKLNPSDEGLRPAIQGVAKPNEEIIKAWYEVVEKGTAEEFANDEAISKEIRNIVTSSIL